MARTSVAARILDDDGFRESYRRKAFWQGHVAPAELAALFTWDTLNQLLATHRLTNDRFRLSREDDHVTPNRQVFRPVRDAFGRHTDYLSLSELHRQMRAGVTGVLEATNELLPAVEALTTEICKRYRARSTANAYFSFGSTSGFGAHNDDHDVIVIQLEGRKTWHFFAVPENCGKATVRELESPTERDIGESIVLGQGDILFVPKGTWHDVVAIGEPSLHLTISIVYATVSDYARWLLDQHRYGLPFHDIRMEQDAPNMLASDCTQFFSEAISEASVAAFLNAYHARHVARRVQPSFPSLNHVGPDDYFVRVPLDFVDVGASDSLPQRFIVSALNRQHLLGEAEYRVFTALSHKIELSVAQLAECPALRGKTMGSLHEALEGLLDRALVTKVCAGE